MQCDSTSTASLTTTAAANATTTSRCYAVTDAVAAVSSPSRQQPQRPLCCSEPSDAAVVACTSAVAAEECCLGKRISCSTSASTFPSADHDGRSLPHPNTKVSASVGDPTTMTLNGTVTSEQNFGQHYSVDATANTTAEDGCGDQNTPLLSNAIASAFTRCPSRHLRDAVRRDHTPQDFHPRRTFPLPRPQHSMASPPPRRCRTELANGGYPSLDGDVISLASATRSASSFMISGFSDSSAQSVGFSDDVVKAVGACRRVVLPINGTHSTTTTINKIPLSSELTIQDDCEEKNMMQSDSSGASDCKERAPDVIAPLPTSSVSFRPPTYNAAINKRNNGGSTSTSNGGTTMSRRQPRKSNVSYSSTASVLDANGETTTIRENDGYSNGGKWETGGEERIRALQMTHNGNGGGPPLPSSSSTLFQQQDQDQQQPFDLENVLLLQRPILPPNSHFFCCFYKFHITVVAKVLSVIYAFLYGFLCLFSYKSEHAPAFLITVLVTVSVAGSTLYAAFKWSKMCLIPFFLLQVMLVFYTMVCLAFLLYAKIVGPSSYYYAAFNFMNGTLQLTTSTWITIFLLVLIALLLFFCYSALLFWYEYQFIAEVDRFLKSIRKSSSQGSKDDQNQNFGTNAAF